MENVKRNFIYNIAYQILIMIIPLITTPYVSRVIGSEGIGTYSYTYSIAYYFMIFAMIGFNNYGNRSIAQVRDDKEKLTITFKEIYLLQIIIALIMTILYAMYLLFFDIQFKFISVIQGLYVISCIFDINWFFFGVENFKLTVVRNTIIKILSLIFIFLFVKDSNDVYIYVLILAGSSLISQLSLFPYLSKYIGKSKIKITNIKKHLMPCLKLFLPVIAVTMYRVMDKTMIGIFSTMSEVGYYENAEKIISIPNAIISALGVVMLPRMSNMYSNGKENESKSTIRKSIKFVMFLSFAMTFGIISISKDFSIMFFGKDFVKTGYLISLLAITIVFLSWGNVLRTQYLIPKERDKEYIISAFLGAFVNFIFNFIFIPKYGAIGACFGTILAEFIVVIYQSYAIRKELPLLKYLYDIVPFFIKSLIMLFIIYFINYLNILVVVKIVLQILLGVFIYLILNIKYILKLVNIRKNSKMKVGI